MNFLRPQLEHALVVGAAANFTGFASVMSPSIRMRTLTPRVRASARLHCVDSSSTTQGDWMSSVFRAAAMASR
ncbi:MAG: hypothetical protein FJW14_09740 [Acidimicrobiia bacterium]|nr:hypothetical protein [Acidimicrobiia bacterium]